MEWLSCQPGCSGCPSCGRRLRSSAPRRPHLLVVPKEYVKGQDSPGAMFRLEAGQKCPTATIRPEVSRKDACNSTPRVAEPVFLDLSDDGQLTVAVADRPKTEHGKAMLFQARTRGSILRLGRSRACHRLCRGGARRKPRLFPPAGNWHSRRRAAKGPQQELSHRFFSSPHPFPWPPSRQHGILRTNGQPSRVPAFEIELGPLGPASFLFLLSFFRSLLSRFSSLQSKSVDKGPAGLYNKENCLRLRRTANKRWFRQEHIGCKATLTRVLAGESYEIRLPINWWSPRCPFF